MAPRLMWRDVHKRAVLNLDNAMSRNPPVAEPGVSWPKNRKAKDVLMAWISTHPGSNIVVAVMRNWLP